MKKVFFSVVAMLLLSLAITAQASVQIIHNSPSPGTDAGPVVDIYVNGALLPELTAVPYRAATAFLPVASGVDIQVGVAVSPSTVNDTIVAFDLGQLAAGESYTVIANGIVGDAANPFNLAVSTSLQVGSDPGGIDVRAFHGSPGAPAVDVGARGITTELFDSVTYGDFTDYLTLDPDVYILEVRADGADDVLAAFIANLVGVEGNAVTVFASGILGNTPNFGLFAALADGTVISLPALSLGAVQIIHNSPGPGTADGPVVDIYVDGELPDNLTGISFREATGYISLIGDIDTDIAIAPSPSTSVADSILTFNLGPLGIDDNYTIIINGIVGSAENPLRIDTFSSRFQALNPGEVDVVVFHGSPDAPAVDVDARGVVNELVDGLAYGELTDYLSLPPANYVLDVRVDDDPNIVATFAAPLSGLAGGAATVFASGLLGDTPGFGLFAALADGTVIELPQTSIAAVQVIHNSPTPGTADGPVVDIYVNGALLPELTAVPFRGATEYLNVPGDTDIQVGVAVSPSTVNDTIVAFDLGQLANNESYTVIANGIVGDAENPFNLAVSTTRQTGSNPEGIDIIAFHGSPGAPPVDIGARGITNELFDSLAFGQFSDYLTFGQGVFILDVRADGQDEILATYIANLIGIPGEALTIFASGILGDTPDFGLFVALSTGDVVPLPAFSLAAAQVIHNSPTPATDDGPVVDVYVNGELFENLTAIPFRAATPYLFLEGDIDTEIGIAVSPSTVNDTIAAFDLGQLVNGENYTIIANGIVGDADNPFNLEVATSRVQADDPELIDVLVFHGSPGAPAVDVDARGVANELVDDLSFGEFTDYLSLPAADYLLDVRANDDPSIVGSFTAPLSPAAGTAATVFASGLLGNTPEFGLFAAFPDGSVLELPATSQAAVQVIHNSPTPGTEAGPVVDIYVNGALLPELTAVPFRAATAYLPVPGDADIQVGVAVNPSTVNDTIVAFDLGQLTNGESYTIFANGIVGDATTPFELAVAVTRQAEANGTDAGLLFFHGSPDAPEVDIRVTDGDVLFDNVSYGNFSEDYVVVPAAAYDIAVTPSNDNDNLLVRYDADVSGLGGATATIFASGLFTADATPAFGAWVALADGTTFPLGVISSTSEINKVVENFSTFPNPATSFTNVNLTLKESGVVTMRLVDRLGREVKQFNYGLLPSGELQERIELDGLASGLYFLQLQMEAGQITAPILLNK